jgi:hypothetical protein
MVYPLAMESKTPLLRAGHSIDLSEEEEKRTDRHDTASRAQLALTNRRPSSKRDSQEPMHQGQISLRALYPAA